MNNKYKKYLLLIIKIMIDYDVNVTIIIITLSLIRILVDISITYKNCSVKPSVTGLLFLHSFIWVYTYLGCLYRDKKLLMIYLITIFMIVLHWMSNDNRCILTTKVNMECNLNKDTKYDRLYLNEDKFRNKNKPTC